MKFRDRAIQAATLLLPPYRIIEQLRTLRQILIFNFSQLNMIYYIKIIPLDSYSKELFDGIIFMSNILYFLD
jgi:hypothetical protein